MKYETPPYQLHETQEHVVTSRFVAQAYRITVFQPIRRTDASERFPVLYVTDADAYMGGVTSIARELHLHGETPRFLVVGVGYQDPRTADLLRMRDFFTHAIRAPFRSLIDQMAAVPYATGVADLKTITNTTDAGEFLSFFREELMPFIAARYPIAPNDNSYCGYSAGATFGLYALCTRPETFRRYILGSPATASKTAEFGIEMVEGLIKSGKELNAKAFISVGELEEFYADFGLTTGYYRLAKYLKRAAIPGLDLTTRVFPGETHATAWTLALTHGLKALFGPAERVPFWPDFAG